MKKKKVLVEWLEKLEALAGKLPGPLQSAILNEVKPVKEVFLLRRPARFALRGLKLDEAVAFLDGLLPGVIPLERTYEISTEPGWMACLIGGKEEFLFSFEKDGASFANGADLELQFTLAPTEGLEPTVPPALDCLIAAARGSLEDEKEDADHRVREMFRLRRKPTGEFDATDLAFLMRRVFGLLPRPAQLSIARLSLNRQTQAQLSAILVRSASGVAAAVGAQPIPLADFPILTALQTAMVAGIMHVSGREPNTRNAAEFLTAIGANLGIGLAFREGTRALLKFVPGWGNAVSGGVAAAGTYAMGKAATAYFIEGISMDNARGVFSKLRRKKQKALPEGEVPKE